MKESTKRKLEAMRGVMEAVENLPDDDAVRILLFCEQDLRRTIDRQEAMRRAEIQDATQEEPS